jgi:hypothetical protein
LLLNFAYSYTPNQIKTMVIDHVDTNPIAFELTSWATSAASRLAAPAIQTHP